MEYVPKVNSFICAEAVADLPPIPDAEAGEHTFSWFCLLVCVLNSEIVPLNKVVRSILELSRFKKS